MGDVDMISIDEAQFMGGMGLPSFVNDLADAGVRVVVAGTDMDFTGKPFGPIPDLMAIAEHVVKLHAICKRCGALATRNQRLVDGRPARASAPQIHVGGASQYEARCRQCHEVPHE